MIKNGLSRLTLVLFCISVIPALTRAQSAPTAKNDDLLTANAGKYRVTLRLPAGGVYADEEVEMEFRVVDMSTDDPVLGPAGVIRASIESIITMPSMPGMPKQVEAAHVEGVPGDYGIHPVFPHGGGYLITLKVNPPGGEPFAVEFPISVKDGDPNRPAKPKPFFVELEAKPSKPTAGEPVDMTFTIRERETNAVVKDFDIAHEKLLHLMIVRKDLGTFAHEHPEIQPDGRFKLKFAFPAEGTYHLFCDVAPRARGSQVVLATLDVKAGKKGRTIAAFAPSGPTADKPTTVEGMRVKLGFDTPQPMTRRQNVLTFTLTDVSSGGAVTDLQPYLGAMGHLVLIHQDGATYVHSHPDESDPAIGRDGVVPFLARFPKAGLYRAWGQFQRKGKILTADFLVRVKEGE